MNTRGDDWAVKALKSYFGATYSEDLADLVIYIDKDKIEQAMIKGNKTKTELSGEEFLYVIVLTHFNLEKVKTEKYLKNSIKGHYILLVQLESIIRKQDPFLRRALSSLGSLFYASPGIGAQAKSPDSINEYAILEKIGKNNDKTLFIAFTKLPLAENTWSRAKVSGINGLLLPKNTQLIVHNFGNCSSSLFNIGISIGVSGIDDTSFIRTNLYIYSTMQFIEFTGKCLCIKGSFRQAPPYHASCGLFLGTSITPVSLFEEFIFGLTINRIIKGMPNLLFGGSRSNLHKNHPIKYFLGVGLEL